MTITRREGSRLAATGSDVSAPVAPPTAPPRRSHVPNDGSAEALAVESARKSMLHEGPVRKRTRIGADAVCEALIRQGVDLFFGYPGGVVLPLYDVLGDYPDLRHILVRHEQGGAHAADGYARATGRVGVCLGTSGPGATNLVTGIGTAQLDSVPIVAITGNVPAALLGKDAFQEIDINGITLPMTKHNYLVRDANDLPRVLAEAFHIARTGRPGPVHVDITKDALQQETAAPHPTHEEIVAGLPGFRPNLDANGRQLKLAAAELASARRPMILAGHGVLHAEAWDELVAFAEKTQIPVAHTLLGVGAMPEDHPLIQAAESAYKSVFKKKPAVDRWTTSTAGVYTMGIAKVPTIGFGPSEESFSGPINDHVRIDDLERTMAFYSSLPGYLPDTEPIKIPRRRR